MVVLGGVHREGVGVGRVGDQERELGRHPLAEVVVLERDAPDDIAGRLAVADRRDHLVLAEGIVVGDQTVEVGQVRVDR